MHRSIQPSKAISSRKTSTSRPLRREGGNLRTLVERPALVFLLFASATAFGASATWNLNPTDSVWQTATNWTPATVPNGPNDIATFGVSNRTAITNDTLHDIEVNGIVFNPGASAFTIAFGNSSFFEDYVISGVGITNNSGITQNFVITDFGEAASIIFKNSATAGDRTVFTAEDGDYEFHDTSTADNATLIANNAFGGILFFDDSTGGKARVQVFDDGNLDISAHNAPGITVGSIEGTGSVFLGANNLTVGSKRLGTTFSGVIQDGGIGAGTGGTVTKIGKGELILTSANRYTGGTTVNGGTLLVENRKGSATGGGAVQVSAGTLGGRGIIAGPSTIGTRGDSFADLSPGTKEGKPEALTFLSTLTFNGGGSYSFELDSGSAVADQVIANGVTIRSRAQFFLADLVNPDVLSIAELYDPASGIWAATSNLANNRYFPTATLLPNGKVLVAGGFGLGFIDLISAELYDPASGTWTATGSLNTARSVHTATLLPNGKVLVAGGQGTSDFLASAELYDSATEKWTATGSLAFGRDYHTATLLPNGKVLVAGGYSSTGGFLASTELYDPATGKWTATGRLANGRFTHTATLLPNGKVLVAGGYGNSGLLASTELYDPATGKWTATGSLITARWLHTATLLPNDKVLVAGGSNAELYDPATGTWTATGSLNGARDQHTATLLPNGKVLVLGGEGTSAFLASAELYDPVSGTWTVTDRLDASLKWTTATLLPEGTVLVAGGYGFRSLDFGTVFTAIRNTSATPINGTFFNLADGSTFTVDSNTFQASYEGGDGNDLTLTVVPQP